MKIKRALISVSDKTGIVEFATFLSDKNIEIISTGGTANLLKESKIPVIELSEYTGFPEIMDGRVKTLHPKIHGGILALRDSKTHTEVAEQQNISMIDLVIVNLYPFQKVIQKSNIDLNTAIENIDIGGPTMLRAAAKNYSFVTVITDIEDYQKIQKEIETTGTTDLKTREQLAVKVFQHTAKYDATIDTFLSKKLLHEEKQHFTCTQGKLLRYGENSHQQAVFYKDPSSKEESVAHGTLLHGKEMSYNNYLDANTALEVVKEFPRIQPAVAIVKHLNPCGLATADTGAKALLKAWEGDPISAFGGIVATNQIVDMEFAEALKGDQIQHLTYKLVEGNYVAEKAPFGKFIEVLIAPGFREDARTFLEKKSKTLRLIQTNPAKGKDIHISRAITGGLLIQEKDHELTSEFNQVTSKKFSEEYEKLSLFGWVACKHIKSNAIVLVRKYDEGYFQLIGMGSGQPNRVDSLGKLAIPKTLDNLKRIFETEQPNIEYSKWCTQQINTMVMVSDAFFPFDDIVRLAHSYGIKYIVQPGGSKRDEDSIQACNELEIAMAFTQLRHFNH